MQIIPTRELMNGRCVTLQEGRFDDPMLWHVDPIATVQGFVATGAERIRVTDFDALRGTPSKRRADRGDHPPRRGCPCNWPAACARANRPRPGLTAARGRW